MTVVTSDNRYGTAQFIVAPTIAQGANYTTIASAIAAASSGQTIFVRPGTYTENLTLKAGVNIAAFDQDAQTPNVTIVGTCTFTAAGTVTLGNIRLQTNGSFLLAVTGSAASIVRLNNCYLNCTDNTGITYTSSSSSSAIVLNDCNGNIATAGTTLAVCTSQGFLSIFNSNIFSTSATTTPTSTSGGGASGGISCVNSFFQVPFSTSSTGSVFLISSTVNITNTTALTTAGTSSTNEVRWCTLGTGSASAISIGAGTTCEIINNRIASDNANAVTGAGQVLFGPNTYVGASSTVNTSTITDETVYAGTLKLHTPLSVANGGTGATTLTGIVTGNGTSAMTANAVTQHGVLIGGASNAASSLGVASTGTVLAGATGADPAFTATPTVTSISFGGTALANYVQGSWTPGIAVAGSATGITYAAQTGVYTRIGNVVFITGIIVLSSKGAGAGTITITGLPINASATDFIGVLSSVNVTLTAAYNLMYMVTVGSSATATLTEEILVGGTSSTHQDVTAAMFTDATDLRFSGFYFV